MGTAAWLRLLLACLAATRVDARGEVGPSLLVSRKDASLVLRQGRSEGPSRRAQLQSSALDTNTELRLRGGGATLSRLLPILLGKKQCRILMLGLDAAGKTTILYQLKLGEMTNTAPTLGFNVETVAYKNIEFMVWDMGGQDAIRQLWQHYYKNAQALIFVVDSSDEERLAEARDELQKLMAEEELRDSVLLVFANKQDMPDARSVQEIAEELGLQELQNRVWYIQACSASTGDGLTDGLDWLVSKMAAKL